MSSDSVSRPSDRAKVILLGNSGTGKTSIVDRFAKGRFIKNTRETVGMEYSSRCFLMDDGRPFNLGLMDTGGQERFGAVTKQYYRYADAAIVCYDVTDATTWKGIKNWVENVKQLNPRCMIYICATKIDLLDEGKKRAVRFDLTTQYSESIGATLFETSCKTGANVSAMFLRIAQDLMVTIANDRNNDTIKLESRMNKEKSKKEECC